MGLSDSFWWDNFLNIEIETIKKWYILPVNISWIKIQFETFYARGKGVEENAFQGKSIMQVSGHFLPG